jgi:hypothetical protein
MAFSVMVELLNMRSRRAQQRRRAEAVTQGQPAGP